MAMSSQGRGAVAAVGMFDGVHAGHRYVLQRVASLAREKGGESMAFTFDCHPLCLVDARRVPQSLCSLEQRLELMGHCGIDHCRVLHFDEALRELTAERFIALLKEKYDVRTLVMGYDHSFGSDRLRTTEQYVQAAAGSGVEIVRAERYILPSRGELVVSSSAVRAALSEGDVALAAEMLGRQYSIDGEIIEGRHLGRTIGFPTANMAVDSAMMLPAPGVYAAIVTLDAGKDVSLSDGNDVSFCDGHSASFAEYPAMVNIGHNPTVNDNPAAPLSVEAHLINFAGSLYGRRLRLRFLRRLRGERRFPTLDALAAQLRADRLAALAAYDVRP